MFYQMYLTMAAGALVAMPLHRPELMISFLVVGWILTIFFMGRIGYMAITRGVLAAAVLQFVLYRFVFPAVWP